MPRRPRLQFPGAMYHAMARGNRKATIFHADEDRLRFLRVLDEAVLDYKLDVAAACLMGNHYHLIFETPRGNLSAAMQFINGEFAQASNRRHGQTGHVFEGRFRSLVIEREGYLKRAVRYVVRNPVRAGIVGQVGDWPWSTYRATAGLEPLPRWLRLEWIQWAFNADSLGDAQRRFVDYVNAPTERRIDLNAIVLGSTKFKDGIAARLDHVDRRIPKRDRPAPPPLSSLFDDVSGSLNARNRAISVARREHGYSFAAIARHLGVNRSTVTRAVRRYRRQCAAAARLHSSAAD